MFNRRKALFFFKSFVQPTTNRQAARRSSECNWMIPYEDGTIDWNSFIRVIGQMSSSEEGQSQLIEFSPGFSSGFLLHEAIKVGAPDKILSLICEKFPETIKTRNYNGEYITHVACSVPGTSPEFINRCINLVPESISAADHTGKTPIHHLCQSYQVIKNDKTGSTAKKMKQILWMLYREGPGSIIAEDNRGINAVEYALESNLGMDFISLLQNMIVRYHRNESREVAQPRRTRSRRGSGRKAPPYAAFAA